MIPMIVIFLILIFLNSFVLVHDDFNGAPEAISTIILTGFMFFIILTKVIFGG